MTYYNTLYYKTLSLELTDCDTCKKRHCKYYLCECDKKILEKNYKYNYQIKKHKRQLRCNKAYSNGKGVYCLNGYHDDCDWKVKQYFKIIEARAFQNKELYNKVVEELNGIINKWENDNDGYFSTSYYNYEEDRMEMKCWYPCDEPFNRWLSNNEILIW